MPTATNYIERLVQAQEFHEFYELVHELGAVDEGSLMLLNSLACHPQSERFKGGLRKHLMQRAKERTVRPSGFGVPLKDFGAGKIAIGGVSATNMRYAIQGPDSLLKNWFITGTTGSGKTSFACMLISKILVQANE